MSRNILGEGNFERYFHVGIRNITMVQFFVYKQRFEDPQNLFGAKITFYGVWYGTII